MRGDSDSDWLTDLAVVDRALADRLEDAGFESVEHVAAATPEQLQVVDGISRGVAARLNAETREVEPSDAVREAVSDLPATDSPAEGEDDPAPDIERLTDIAGVSELLARRLRDAGFESVEHVAAATPEQLQAVDGISSAFAARIDAETDPLEVEEAVKREVTPANAEAGGERVREPPPDRGPAAAADITRLTDITGVDERLARRLRDSGFETIEHVAAATPEQLQAVDGVRGALAARIAAETDPIEVREEVRTAVAPAAETATVGDHGRTADGPGVETSAGYPDGDEPEGDRRYEHGGDPTEPGSGATPEGSFDTETDAMVLLAGVLFLSGLLVVLLWEPHPLAVALVGLAGVLSLLSRFFRL